MSLSSGTTLGPYQIVSQLGQGIVYTATDPRLKRTAAIKLLPPDLTRDETAKQRFSLRARDLALVRIFPRTASGSTSPRVQGAPGRSSASR